MVGSGADPGLWTVSTQVSIVINPALGCHYFPLGYLPSQRASPHFGQCQIILLGDMHMHVNNLSRVVTRKWNGLDSNPRPLDRKSNALTIAPPCHFSAPVKCCSCTNIYE